MKLNLYAKPTCQNTILHQAKIHKILMDKAATALEAKSDEKGVPGKKPLVGKKGLKPVGRKKPLVGEKRKVAVTKKPASEKKPNTEKKEG